MTINEQLKCYREFVQVVGHLPPVLKCPQGTLYQSTMEKLKERPDLVDWALGRI